MLWLVPKKIKVYEALGTLADGRLEINENSAKSYSSSRNKFYTVCYDPSLNSIMCNDNSSYYIGTLGYPAIAFLMIKGILPYNPEYASWFKGIAWKDLNTQFKNDFSKTEEFVLNLISSKGGNIEELSFYASSVLDSIKQLGLSKLGSPVKPPLGY